MSIEAVIQRLPHGEGLPLPSYQSSQAAGMDIHAAVEQDQPWQLNPRQVLLVPSGFCIALPEGYEAQIRPRSGLATKHRITLPNSPGTIDADYRGEVKIALANFGDEPFEITRGMRIAQMIVAPVTHVTWLEAEALEQSQRGDGGFGHTGM